MINEFVYYLRETDHKEGTIKAYRGALNQFSKWFEGATDKTLTLDEITPADIAAYKRHLMEKSKPATVNKHISAIKALCSWAVTEGHLKINPATEVKQVNLQRQAPKWLDRKEQHKVIRLAEKDGPRNLAVVMLMMKAGLRVDEVCNLRVSDVNISERKGSVTVAYGKGDKWRSVPLNNGTRKAVVKYLEVRDGILDTDSPWLFKTQKAKKMQPRTVQHIMEKYSKEIPGLTAHKLRHTFCHELVKAGVSLDQVAVLAGHMTADGRPNVSTTVIYTRPGEEDLREAVSRLDWE